MKLVVRNTGTDTSPLYMVFTETGEEIENVQTITMSESCESHGIVQFTMSWLLKNNLK